VVQVLKSYTAMEERDGLCEHYPRTLLTATLILGNCLGAQERLLRRTRTIAHPPRIISALDQWTQCIHDVTGKFLLLARIPVIVSLSCPSSSSDFSKRMTIKCAHSGRSMGT